MSKLILEVLSDRRWAPLGATVIREYRDKVPDDLEQREQLRQVLLWVLAEEGDSVLRQLTVQSLAFFAYRKDVEDVLMGMLRDPDEARGVRYSVFTTLAETGNWQQREPFVCEMLSDQQAISPRPPNRFWADER